MSDLSRFLLILALIPCLAGAADVRNITIATDATFPPFHYVDDAGIVTGFDVESDALAIVIAVGTTTLASFLGYSRFAFRTAA